MGKVRDNETLFVNKRFRDMSIWLFNQISRAKILDVVI